MTKIAKPRFLSIATLNALKYTKLKRLQVLLGNQSSLYTACLWKKVPFSIVNHTAKNYRLENFHKTACPKKHLAL